MATLVTRYCSGFEWRPMLAEWSWRVPPDHTPILFGLLGDWILAALDGSHWNLNLLEGDYIRVAGSAAEFNALVDIEQHADEWLSSVWVCVAEAAGIWPQPEESLCWKVPPLLGGAFDESNLGVMHAFAWQSIMSQLCRRAAATMVAGEPALARQPRGPRRRSWLPGWLGGMRR
jgi:hypothetical protein